MGATSTEARLWPLPSLAEGTRRPIRPGGFAEVCPQWAILGDIPRPSVVRPKKPKRLNRPKMAVGALVTAMRVQRVQPRLDTSGLVRSDRLDGGYWLEKSSAMLMNLKNPLIQVQMLVHFLYFNFFGTVLWSNLGTICMAKNLGKGGEK